MKKITLLFGAMALFLVSSCEVDPVDADALAAIKADEERRGNPNSRPNNDPPADVDVDTSNLGETCNTYDLMAGQHHVAGDVSVYNDGENIIVVYTSNGDWDLGITHLALGNCDEDWVPLTRSGKPKNGRFDYVDPYSATADEVVYVIPLDGLDDNFCFAAHAEVQGPTGGETAWAKGMQFSGSGWAMYAQAQKECPNDDDDGDDDDDDGGNLPT